MFNGDPQGWVLVAPGAALVALSLAKLGWRVWFRRVATRVEGITLEPRTESHEESEVYRIRFEYPGWDQRHVRERKNAALTRHGARAGRRVVVLIPPEQPDQGRLLEEVGLVGWMVSALIGTTWIALAVLAYMADAGDFHCFIKSQC